MDDARRRVAEGAPWPSSHASPREMAVPVISRVDYAAGHAAGYAEAIADVVAWLLGHAEHAYECDAKRDTCTLIADEIKDGEANGAAKGKVE